MEWDKLFLCVHTILYPTYLNTRVCRYVIKLSDDLKIDYESYSWKKLDPTTEDTKTKIEEYLSWEGKFDGKKFNQGKIYKWTFAYARRASFRFFNTEHCLNTEVVTMTFQTRLNAFC